MNILAITSSYPRYEGDPTAPFIESITRHVAARGHTVHLLVPEHHAWHRPASEDGVTYHRYRYTPRRSWTPWGFSDALDRGVTIRRSLFPLAPVVAVSAARSANRLLGRQRFDVVHAHWVIPNGPIAAFAAHRHRVPLVVSLHGSDVSVSERVGLLGRASRWTFERAAAVTAPSENLLERSRALGAREPIAAIPYGADVDELSADPAAVDALRAELHIPPDHVVVAGIGRFVVMKGFPYLIDAMARARRLRPDLHLVLVGDGDLRGELEDQVRALNASSYVTFPGMADRESLRAYLALADIVVVPSVHTHGHLDGLPNVALEAMAAGKPLVASRAGGLPQLVRDRENGLLVDQQDADALAAAIVELSDDPGLRGRLGLSAQNEIRTERSWDVVAERFVEIYERAVGAR